MPAIDLPAELLTELPLSSPLFAKIRTKAARAYIEHKVELGVAGTSDEEIVERVDEITAILLGGLGRAVRGDAGTAEWMANYRWFALLVSALLDGEADAPLDG